jgi:hypothetical protein
MTAEVSHGRGGAGNLAPDDTKYVDGEVVRSGVEGSHGDGAYSSGRGGKPSMSSIPQWIELFPVISKLDISKQIYPVKH